MATKAKTEDRPQVAFINGENEAIANGGSVAQFGTQYSTADRIGIEITRLEYYFTAAEIAALIVGGAGAGMCFGLTQIANNIPDLDPVHLPGVIDHRRLLQLQAALTSDVYHLPIQVDFEFPVLVHPASLYFFTRGIGLAIVIGAGLGVRMWYKIVELADKDYNDILQTIIAQNII